MPGLQLGADGEAAAQHGDGAQRRRSRSRGSSSASRPSRARARSGRSLARRSSRSRGRRRRQLAESLDARHLGVGRLVGPHEGLVGGDGGQQLGVGAVGDDAARRRGSSTRSASAIVDTRWATTSVVVSSSRRRPARICCSTAGSTAEVASSRSSRRGLAQQGAGQGEALALPAGQRDAPLADHRRRARGRARRRTRRRGRRRAAQSTVVVGHVGAESVRFSRTVSANRNVSWNTSATDAAQVVGVDLGRGRRRRPRSDPPIGSHEVGEQVAERGLARRRWRRRARRPRRAAR